MSAKTLLLSHGDFPHIRESGKGEVAVQLLSLAGFMTKILIQSSTT